MVLNTVGFDKVNCDKTARSSKCLFIDFDEFDICYISASVNFVVVPEHGFLTA